MDKNPAGGGAGALGGRFAGAASSLLCSDAFAKEAAVARILGMRGPVPAVLLDFDRLYAGYAGAGMLPAGAGGGALEAHTPTRRSWPGIFGRVADRASAGPAVVIVDSLNGFFAAFGGKDAGRYADACMMMLASCAGQAGGKLFLCSVARPRGRGGGGWALHPTGRQVLESAAISRFLVRGGTGDAAAAAAAGGRPGAVVVEPLLPDGSPGGAFCL